jgi:hypothetical protein
VEEKYSVFPSGDQLAQSPGVSSDMVIQSVSGTGFGPFSGAMAMRARFG